MKKEKQPYILSADVVRVMAIIGVVIVHTANAVYARPDFFGGLSWWIAIVLNSFSRISIPLFIMISGYFILSKNEKFKDSLSRTASRIFIPLIVWFLIYVIWNAGEPTFQHINSTLLVRLLTVNVFDLYFLIILLGLYVTAPFLRSFLARKNYSQQKIVMFALVVFGILFFAVQYLLFLCSPAISFVYWIPYIGLFVAGYFFGNNISKTKSMHYPVGFFALSLGVTIVGNYFYYLLHNNGNTLLDARGCLSHYTDSYLSINVVVMALSAFIILMKINYNFIGHAARKIIYSVARASFGIYVLHVIFLDILDSWFHFFDPIAPAWLYIIVKWTVIFSLSYVSTVVLIKIPLIKKIFGEAK